MKLVTFPKIYLRRFSKKISLVTMDCVAMATKLSEGSQDKKVYIDISKHLDSCADRAKAC